MHLMHGNARAVMLAPWRMLCGDSGLRATFSSSGWGIYESRGSVFQATSVIPIPLKRGLEAPVRVPQNPMGRRRSCCRRPRRQRPSCPLRDHDRCGTRTESIASRRGIDLDLLADRFTLATGKNPGPDARDGGEGIRPLMHPGKQELSAWQRRKRGRRG